MIESKSLPVEKKYCYTWRQIGDSPEDNKYFKEKFSFPFDILSDYKLEITKET